MDMENINIATIKLSVSVTKTKTYEVKINDELVHEDVICEYGEAIGVPIYQSFPEDEILEAENPDIIFCEQHSLNLAKIVAYMKMKFGTIPVLSEPNGISIVEIHDNKRNEISEFVMDKDVTAVKFEINEYYEGD